VALCAAAIIGDATGYWIGYRAGKALYSRPNSFFFRREHLIKTHEFYERHGGKTIVIARFMPIIRTFAPVVAGAASMTYKRFAAYNIAGGIAWVLSMTLTGYFLGRSVPNIDKNLHLLVAGIIFLSLLPAIIAYLRGRLQARSVSPTAG
jgi:membrane-associated protein